MASVVVKHHPSGGPADPSALVDGPTYDNDPHIVTGLENVDNTSDVNKPVSTAQAAANALKVAKAGDTMTGALTITPTAASNNRGLAITQSTPNSGTLVGPNNLNLITITDNAQSVTGGFPLDSWGQINDQTSGLRINHLINGGTTNHFGFNVAQVSTASHGGGIPVLASHYVNSSIGATPIWAMISDATVGPSGATTHLLIGHESEMLIADTGSANHRIAYSANSQGPTQGTNIDAAYAIDAFDNGVAHFLTAAPFKDGFYITTGLYSARYPVQNNVMRSDTGTVTNLFNFATVTVTGNILSTPNVTLTGSGSLRLANVVNSGAFIVNPNSGTVNASFIVDTSAPSAATGVYIFAGAAGNGAAILTTSSGANENLGMNAKAAGQVLIGHTSTGGILLAGGGGNVSVGNESPKTTLDVNANRSSSPALIVPTSVAKFQAADAVSGGAEFVTYGAGAAGGNIVSGGAAGGTAASPAATAAGQYMYNMRGYGYNSGWQLSGIWIMRTSEAWSAGHQGTAHDWYTTPNASTTIQLSMTLQASGGLSLGTSTDPGSGNFIATGSVQPGSFTVAGLPAGVTGKIVFCSNCRVFNGAGTQEGAGAGTGGLVSYNGTAWKIAGTNVTAIA